MSDHSTRFSLLSLRRPALLALRRGALLSLLSLRRTALLAIVLLSSLLLGCAKGSADAGDAIEMEAARLSDSLLDRAELQRIVDLQVARDGAGLTAHLSDENPLVRARALHALASVQDSAAVSAILPLLEDPEWTVRRDAAFALGQAGVARAADDMLRLLEGEEVPAVRRRLMEAVGKIGDASALRGLHASTVRPGDEAERMLALARFGVRGLHRPEVVETLVAALDHADPSVRENAAYYFGRVSPADPWLPVAEPLRAALDAAEQDDPAAMHLLTGLARLADPADRERFTRWFEEGEDPRIRTNAVRALGSQQDGARVRDALVAALDDPSTHVAVTAATSLASGELPSGELERVRRWVEANPREWRVAAPFLSVLVREGHADFVIEWMEGWEDDEASPRTRALAALAAAPEEEALPVILEAAASSHPRIRAAAVQSLAVRWESDQRDDATHERYFDAFRSALDSGDPASLGATAPVMFSGAFQRFGARELLESHYRAMRAPDDAEPMSVVIDALAEVGDDAAIAMLREALDDPHPPIRRRSARALERATGEIAEIDNGDESDDAEATIDWEALRELGRHPRLILETAKGTVAIALAPEEAPMSVQAIARFAQEGRYDGVPFHRVVPNFVIQTGDFRGGDRATEGDPARPIRSEFTGIHFERGVIGMASSGKDTETSQFFVTHSMQPHLDGGYTAFGWVVEGMDVVDSLYEDDRITRASVTNDVP